MFICVCVCVYGPDSIRAEVSFAKEPHQRDYSSQGLFSKRARSKRLYSAKWTCNFKAPTNCRHPIFMCVCVWVCGPDSIRAVEFCSQVKVSCIHLLYTRDVYMYTWTQIHVYACYLWYAGYPSMLTPLNSSIFFFYLEGSCRHMCVYVFIHLYVYAGYVSVVTCLHSSCWGCLFFVSK